jgi:CubicO group peptidase (beta-lactamase class C family)
MLSGDISFRDVRVRQSGISGSGACRRAQSPRVSRRDNIPVVTTGREGLQEVVDDLAGAFAREQGLAGLGVGIVRDGGLVHSVGIGHASIAGQHPLTSESVFRVGSISKTFTALAIMRLVADGRVDLDGPVNEYLRHYRVETPPGAPPVRLRHLLTHTSGIGELRHYSDVLRPFFGMGVLPDRPVPSLAEYYAPALHTEVPAGRKWAYANHGFATLGAVVEDLTDERFADYMRREILDPLGMTGSDFVRNERVAGRLCEGYARRRGLNKPVRYLDIIPSPAGSLFSSVDDMARYIAALCDGSGKVLDAALLDQMMCPQFSIDPRLPAMGLAFFLSDIDGRRIVGHDGGVNGFVSYLRVAPDDGVGVVAFTNSANVRVTLAIDRFGDELLRAALAARTAGKVNAVPEVEATPSIWPELCGTYGLQRGLNTNLRPWMLIGGEVEVFVRDDQLALRCFAGPARGPAPLRPVDASDPKRFDVDLGPVSIDIAFTDGAIHIGPPLNVTLTRRNYSYRHRSRVAAICAAALAVIAISRRH